MLLCSSNPARKLSTLGENLVLGDLRQGKLLLKKKIHSALPIHIAFKPKFPPPLFLKRKGESNSLGGLAEICCTELSELLEFGSNIYSVLSHPSSKQCGRKCRAEVEKSEIRRTVGFKT